MPLNKLLQQSAAPRSDVNGLGYRHLLPPPLLLRPLLNGGTLPDMPLAFFVSAASTPFLKAASADAIVAG